MDREILIVLPDVLPVLRDGIDTTLRKNVQEFNIYFKNIILPYREEYDVRVLCEYGSNYGTFWRLSKYPHDVDAFDLEIVIYNEYGERIASKKTVVELYDRNCKDAPYHMIFVGDSMTFMQKYTERIAANLHNIVFEGGRCVFGHIRHEGRGGWSYRNYLMREKSCGGDSPFLFPVGVDNYGGDIEFLEQVNAEPRGEYNYEGFARKPFTEDKVYSRGMSLYTLQKGEWQLYDENPAWEVDFAKYRKRYEIGPVDAVSLLLGANDLQLCPYEESEERIATYLNNTQTVIDAIHRYDPHIDIIINMPVTGAEQYCWGTRLGCNGSSKMYRFNIIKAGKAILERWGNREEEHIYIGPMLLALDPVYGFPRSVEKVNMHSEALEEHQSNWVHPNQTGYYQMGDAICGVIQKARRR